MLSRPFVVREVLGNLWVKSGKRPQDFDRKGARAGAQKPPPCSFYFDEGVGLASGELVVARWVPKAREAL